MARAAAALALVATARAQLTSVGSGMSHEVPPLAHVDTHKMIVANTGNDDLGPEAAREPEVFDFISSARVEATPREFVPSSFARVEEMPRESVSSKLAAVDRGL
jgi:hypothetical protein